MENRLGSADSKEILGGLETSFAMPKSGSTDTAENRLSLENNETELNTFQPNTDPDTEPKTGKVGVSSSLRSKSSETQSLTGSLTPSNSLLMTNEKIESKDSEQKSRIVKSVSFRIEDQEVSEEFDAMSQLSMENSVTDNKTLQNHNSFSSINSLIKGTTTSKKNLSMLENIPEVDENILEVDAAPGYYGWDGYETRFKESIADYESWSSIPGCVPPWAKSVRKKYGLSPTESFEKDEIAETKRTVQEKLEHLMKKHKELMLLKRVESKKQLIVEPNKDPHEMDTIKMREKSTRYYMTPLVLNGTKQSKDDYVDENEKVSLPSLSDSNSLSFTKKTSRPQAKKEISQVLKSLQKSVSKERRDHQYKVKKENDKCPKITLSNIREFVSMSPDERKLHEIIKIEKVPSVQDLKERGKPSSKYIINVPKNTITDKPTVNVIKIKEKRKLRVNSIENIEEKVTELHYNQGGTRRQAKRDSDYNYRDSCDTEPRRHIHTTTKSPTETKTFQVKTKQTPLLSPLISEEDKKTEKVLLLQYDKKSKNDKRTTQLVGIKEPCSSGPGELYLYRSDTEGKRVKENLTTGQEIPLTLKDKVHSIFEELRGLKLKQNVPADMKSAEVQVSPSVDSKITQRPSHVPATTELVAAEAKPEVRSTAVQARESLILKDKSDSSTLLAPQPSPVSDFVDQEEIQPSLDKNTLLDKFEDLDLDEASLEKPVSIDKVSKDEREIEQESLKESQDVITKDKPEAESTAEIENKAQIVKSEESVGETGKEVEKKTQLNDKTNIDQSGQVEIPDQDKPEAKETITEDETKQPVGQAQEYTGSELSKDMSKDLSEQKPKKLSKEKSQESVKQLEEENKTTPSTDDMKQLSKTPSRRKSTIESPQDKGFEELPTVFSEERNIPLKKSSDDEQPDSTFVKMSFPKEYEDIRSYEFGSQQGTELVIKSSSKFLHEKDDLRKKMNWTNDTIFLEKNTCPQLIRGLAETAMRQPDDPVAFLAHWIYKDCENRERGEQEEVRKEHLHLARAMAEVAGGDALTRKKFNVEKYPINEIEEEKHSEVIAEEEEEGEFPEDMLEDKIQTNEITQEA